jgi:mRNA interferase RelE/StbE
MIRYSVSLDRSAQKQLRAVTDVRLFAKLERAILDLAQTPRPAGCVKLSGRDGLWRIRVGDWRVVYRIEDARLVVLVISLAPRGGVYR